MRVAVYSNYKTLFLAVTSNSPSSVTTKYVQTLHRIMDFGEYKERNVGSLTQHTTLFPLPNVSIPSVTGLDSGIS